jgi:adenosylhomocysteine nucleosidase
MGAMPVEAGLLKKSLQDEKTESFLGRKILRGHLGGADVALVVSGIGKVNSAATAALLLEKLKPSAVIFTGIAGAVNPGLLPGDIVVAEKVAQYDYGVFTPEGFRFFPTKNVADNAANPLFFQCGEKLLAAAGRAAATVKFAPVDAAGRLPKVIRGVIVTGDAFVSSDAKRAELRKDFGADAAEMEGASVAQICFQSGTPFIVIRSLSDGAGNAAKDDYEKFAKAAAENSEKLVTAIIAELTNSRAADK